MSADELTREDRAELFLLQVRGQIATAFNHSGLVPTNDDWCILRGLEDPTMRQIGEIAWRTGFNPYLQLHENTKPAALRKDEETPK